MPNTTGPTNATTLTETVTFSEAVTGLDTTDFTVTGTNNASATVSSVTATATPGVYTVALTNVAGTGSLQLNLLNDSTVKDTAGNALTAGITGTATTVDHTAPTVASIAPNTTGPTNATTLTETVTFSEAVTGLDTTDFTVTGTNNASATVSSVIATATPGVYTVALTNVAGTGSLQLNLLNDSTVKDTAGNALTAGITGTATTVDHTAPTVASIAPNTIGPTNATTLTETVTFSEAVTGLDTTDFSVTGTNGATATVSSVTATATPGVYTVALTNVAGTGSLQLNLLNDSTVKDTAGNALTAGITGTATTVDHTAPTVTSIVPNTIGPTNAASITERVTFSEAVTGVDASDFAISATSTASASIGAVTSVSATTYDVVLTGLTGDGTVRLDLKATATGITDAAGNLTAGYTNGTTFTLDNTGPNTPTIALAHDTGTSSTDGLTNDASLVINRTENGFILYQVDSAAASYSYDPTALADGQHTVSIREVDALGNASTEATLSFTLDRTAPKASLTGVSGQTNHETGHSLSGELGAADAGLTVTVRDGATVLGTTTADGAGHFGFAFTDTKDGPTHSYSLTASAIDAAGNAGASDSFVFAFDYSANRDLFGTVAHDSTSHLGQVYALYEGLLDRAPDQDGAHYFVDVLDHGATLKDVTQAFLSSGEGQSHLGAASNADYVEQLYGNVLNRASDAGGKQAWVTALDQGASRADVADSFVFSGEHLGQLKGAYDVGVYLADPTDAAVARLYHGVLDRAPDASGLASFTAQAMSVGVASVAQNMLSSQEFSNAHGNLSDSAFVDSLYVGALGHHADANATAYWTGQLAQSGRVQVAVQISESAEAQAHLVGVIEQGWHLT